MKKARKFLSILLAVLLFSTTCLGGVGNVSALGFERINYQGVNFENGGIASEVGTNSRVLPDTVRTQDFLKIEDFERVEIGEGYIMCFVTYSERDITQRVASSGWFAAGEDCSMEQLKNLSSRTRNAQGNVPAYFRIIVAHEDNSNITTLPDGAFKLTKSSAPQESVPPTMAQGTIDKGTIHSHVTTRLHTEDVLPISDYENVILAPGYKATYHLYNEKGEWIGSYPEWVSGRAMPIFTTDQMFDTNKLHNYVSGITPLYFRFQIKYKDFSGTPVPVSSIPNMGLHFVKNDSANESQLNYKELKKESDFTYENVYEIGAAYNGPWQEGAISNGNIFVFNHDGEGEVHSLAEKTKIGDIILDKREVITPHSNSLVFGSYYYEKGDKYPLLYSSVFNNYSHLEDRREGTCCVYRVLEEGNTFKTQLVQIIKIGFTEDLDLWKSLSGNQEIRPYGNFVVDTDNNDLYSYVVRDADQITRFFKFDLPKPDAGKLNTEYGCNIVVLEKSDIIDRFDTEYIYTQGGDYVNGMIISSSGLGYGNEGDASLKIIDLKSKKLIKTYDAVSGGVYNEAEILAVDRETKKVYYGSTDGQLRYLTCIDQYINKSQHNEHIYSENYKYDDDNHWFECDVCSKKKDVEPHEYTNSCDTKCNICGETRKVPDHTYKKYKTTDATTSKDGKKYYKCENCGATKTSTIYKASKVYLSTEEYTYNGKTKKPSVKVYDSKGKKLDYGDDYTYSRPSSSKYVGKYKIKITFKGDYTGSKTLYYTINPDDTKISSVTAAKKSLKVKISKQSSQTTGYQIQYSTSSKFKSKYTRSKTIKSYKTTSVTLKSLKAKKNYYVRVRTYKTVDSKKYYSDWSKSVKKKTK